MCPIYLLQVAKSFLTMSHFNKYYIHTCTACTLNNKSSWLITALAAFVLQKDLICSTFENKKRLLKRKGRRVFYQLNNSWGGHSLNCATVRQHCWLGCEVGCHYTEQIITMIKSQQTPKYFVSNFLVQSLCRFSHSHSTLYYYIHTIFFFSSNTLWLYDFMNLWLMHSVVQ